MADASLVAGDAGADVVQPARLRLVRHLGIGDLGAGHAAHVGLARGNDALGVLGLVDAPGDEHRDRHQLLHRVRHGREITCLDVHRRNNMDRTRKPDHRARDNVEVIYATLVADEPADLHQLVGVGALDLELVA